MIYGAMLSGSSRAMQELRMIESLIRSDIWNRWVAKAQRNALVWWQQRRVPPGVAARFTISGVTYYGFGSRLRKPYSIPPYYSTRSNGGLEQAILSRKPRTSRMDGTVVSRLAFGGGALNFMTTTSRPDMRPVVGWTRNSRAITETYNVASYTRSTKSGASVTIAGYSATRTRTLTKSAPVRGGDTYAVAFGRFAKDRPVIQARVLVELRKIVRKAAYTKGGDIRAAWLRPLKEST